MTSYSAWLTHIVDCAGDRLWGFLVGGAIVFPVGIVHGAGFGSAFGKGLTVFRRSHPKGRIRKGRVRLWQ